MILKTSLFRVFFAAVCVAMSMVQAEDPRDLIVRVGYESAAKWQQEANRRIDEESTRLSKFLTLAEKRSKIDRRMDGAGENVQLEHASGFRAGINGLPDPNISFETAHLVFARPADRKEFIEKTKARLDELESERDTFPKWHIPDFDLDSAWMNQSGWLHFDELRVVQNLGDGTFLGKFEFSNTDVDLPAMLVVGMPGAKDLSDDKRINESSIQKILGTKKILVMCNRTHQYMTVNNVSRTVLVLEFCSNLKSVEAYIATHVPKEDRQPRVKPKTRREVERVWSDKSGKFSIRATLKSVADGKVTLLKADGTEKVVPLDVLSKKDLDWVEGWKE